MGQESFSFFSLSFKKVCSRHHSWWFSYGAMRGCKINRVKAFCCYNLFCRTFCMVVVEYDSGLQYLVLWFIPQRNTATRKTEGCKTTCHDPCHRTKWEGSMYVCTTCGKHNQLSTYKLAMVAGRSSTFTTYIHTVGHQRQSEDALPCNVLLWRGFLFLASPLFRRMETTR